jgi:hypothetical protein
MGSLPDLTGFPILPKAAVASAPGHLETNDYVYGRQRAAMALGRPASARGGTGKRLTPASQRTRAGPWAAQRASFRGQRETKKTRLIKIPRENKK